MLFHVDSTSQDIRFRISSFDSLEDEASSSNDPHAPASSSLASLSPSTTMSFNEKTQLPAPGSSSSKSQPPLCRSPLKTVFLFALGSLSLSALLLLPSLFPAASSFLDLSSFLSSPSGSQRLSVDRSTLAIDWKPCPSPTSSRFSCATYVVPLDHSGVEEGEVKLALSRYSAEKGKKKLGTLFINPGGPGGSGFSYTMRAGPSISTITNGQYDIVGWDPRGVGKSEPAYRCFDSALQEDLFMASVPAAPSLPFNLSIHPSVLSDFQAQLQPSVAYSRLRNQVCQEKNRNGIGRFLSTASVVRDLELLSRAAWTRGDEKGINYWGFSYGTAIGAQLTGIFPNRIGRVVIDGILDPIVWSTIRHEDLSFAESYFRDTDKVMEGFASECVKAGSTRCSLATTPPQTAEALLQTISDLLDKTYSTPLPVPNASLFPTVLTSAQIQMFLLMGMYKPRGWATMADGIRDALNGDGRDIIGSQEAPNSDPSAPASSSYLGIAVDCNDSPPSISRNYSDAKVAAVGAKAMADTRNHVSNWFGGSMEVLDECVGWTTREDGFGRFSGPFNKTLSNSILLVGNSADPVCSVANAYKINAFQPQSRVVHQNSYGHCSTSIASLCTVKHIQSYFLEGVLPETNVVCETDEPYFADTSSSIAAFAGDNDGGLLGATKEMGRALEELHNPLARL